jgi:hypothetical protein
MCHACLLKLPELHSGLVITCSASRLRLKSESEIASPISSNAGSPRSRSSSTKRARQNLTGARSKLGGTHERLRQPKAHWHGRVRVKERRRACVCFLDRTPTSCPSSLQSCRLRAREADATLGASSDLVVTRRQSRFSTAFYDLDYDSSYLPESRIRKCLIKNHLYIWRREWGSNPRI